MPQLTENDLPRDRWGRPLVTPPDGGKPVAYTRCTTFIDAIDDKTNLTKWKARQVAVGLALKPDLHALACGYAADPDENKRRLDQLCEDAMQAADAHSSANYGTALHALTERIDRGLDVGTVPNQFKPHLDAYRQATAPFTAQMLETFTVCDELRVGGTPDRIMTVDGLDGLFIGDVKTGNLEFTRDGSPTYGALKFAMQLAIYSHSVLYNPATGERAPIPGIRQDLGVIIALNAKTAECRLLWVDLQAGWEAVQVCRQVRDWRKREKTVARPFTPPLVLPDTPLPQPETPTHAAVVAAITSATTVDDLLALRDTAGEQWTDEYQQLAAERVTQIQTATAA